MRDPSREHTFENLSKHISVYFFFYECVLRVLILLEPMSQVLWMRTVVRVTGEEHKLT